MVRLGRNFVWNYVNTTESNMSIPVNHVSQIIKNHIRHNGMDATHDDLMNALAEKVKEGFKIVKFNNVLFAYQLQGNHLLLTIVNGDHPRGYLMALRKFVNFMRKIGAKYLMMYVQDKDLSAKIAASSGLGDITFRDADPSKVDPYLMLAEVS